MKNCLVFVALCMAPTIGGCTAPQVSSGPSSPTPTARAEKPDVAGVWAQKSENGLVVLVLRPDLHGGVLVTGDGDALGAPFEYTVNDGSVLIKPSSPGSTPFQVTVEGDRSDQLRVKLPEGERVLKRIQPGDTELQTVAAEFERDLDPFFQESLAGTHKR